VPFFVTTVTQLLRFVKYIFGKNSRKDFYKDLKRGYKRLKIMLTNIPRCGILPL